MIFMFRLHLGLDSLMYCIRLENYLLSQSLVRLGIKSWPRAWLAIDVCLDPDP